MMICNEWNDKWAGQWMTMKNTQYLQPNYKWQCHTITQPYNFDSFQTINSKSPHCQNKCHLSLQSSPQFTKLHTLNHDNQFTIQ